MCTLYFLFSNSIYIESIQRVAWSGQVFVPLELGNVPRHGHLVLSLLVAETGSTVVKYSEGTEINPPWSHNFTNLSIRRIIIIFYCRNMEIHFKS